MYNISIISSSVRSERKSHRVALFFKKYLEDNKLAETEILDLSMYAFPLFDEILSKQKAPLKGAIDFSEKVNSADGIILVTPEYNGGYPASLKNATDLLDNEWYHKPVAISTVSNGHFGGSQVITSIQFSLWKMKAWTVPAMFPVPYIDKAFDENGKMKNDPMMEKRASKFIDELFWCIKAKSLMDNLVISK